MCICALNDEGLEASRLVAAAFNNCVYTTSEIVSFWSGWFSIGMWVAVNWPQLFMNWRTRSAEGLSPLFLLQWMSGDVFGIIGVFLLDGLDTQKALAVYYVFADSLLVLQWFAYRPTEAEKATAKLAAASETESSDPDAVVEAPKNHGRVPRSAAEARQGFIVLTSAFAILIVAVLVYFFVAYADYSSQDVCATTPSVTGWRYTVGTIFGYAAVPLYIGSRPAQISRNYKRKSVVGMSLAFFVSAAVGNYSQMVSILSYSRERAYLVRQIPYMLSSGGVSTFDIVICCQYFYYTSKATKAAAAAAAAVELDALKDADSSAVVVVEDSDVAVPEIRIVRTLSNASLHASAEDAEGPSLTARQRAVSGMGRTASALELFAQTRARASSFARGPVPTVAQAAELHVDKAE
jgi:hypothetical protein